MPAPGSFSPSPPHRYLQTKPSWHTMALPVTLGDSVLIESVNSPFSIYRVIGGLPTWVEAQSTLDLAQARVQELIAACPCEYIIYDRTTEGVLTIKPDKAALQASQSASGH